MHIPDYITKSMETIFGLKILKFFDADPDPGWKNSDPGSGKKTESATLLGKME
jgi:hypothetical protein